MIEATQPSVSLLRCAESSLRGDGGRRSNLEGGGPRPFVPAFVAQVQSESRAMTLKVNF